MAGAQVFTLPGTTHHENLGGLTGRWEPENNGGGWPVDSGAARSPSPATVFTPRECGQNSATLRSEDTQKDNSNFPGIENNNMKLEAAVRHKLDCDRLKPEEGERPEFPELLNINDPAETGSAGSPHSDERADAFRGAADEASGTGEGVRWVYNSPFLHLNGSESPLYGPDQGESDENFRLSDVSYLDSTLQHDSHGKPSKPKLAKNEKSGHGILSNGRNGKVKKRSDLKQMQQNSKAATHCEIKRLLTSPLGLGALQYSGLPCLPRPEMQPPLVVQYFRELARRTQSNIANGGLNIAVMPFESCATMPLGGGSSESFGRQLSSTPPTPTGDDVTKYDSGNRKARRKNIGKSRQLRKNNLLSSPATLPDNYTALVTPPQMSKSSASSSENSPDDSSTLAPLNLSTKHKEVPEQISPNFVAMVSDCRQQGFSSSRTSSSGEHLEHSTFDCAVCEESVCQLLDGHQQRQPRSNSSSVSATEEDDVTTAKAVGSHVCDFCQVTFASAQKLKSHRRCHLKPFPCTVCSKSFTNSGNLKKHMRTHTGEKPYRCPLCDAAWANPSNLKRHMLKHDIHKCSSCGADFPNSATLSVVTERLSGSRLYVCRSCLAADSTKFLKGKQAASP